MKLLAALRKILTMKLETRRLGPLHTFSHYYALTIQIQFACLIMALGVRRRMSRTINKLRRKHPNAEVLFQQMKIPNAVNLFSRLKVQKAIKAERNYFLSLQNDEKELITLISSLCNTNYPPRNVTPFNAWQTSNVDY